MPAPLEIHVPISPTPNYFNRIHYLAASLKDAGGLAAESSIVVTVGEDQDPVDLASLLPWSRKYPIRWRWLDRECYRRFTYYGTALDRFQLDFSAPMVLMLDADMLVARDFDDVIHRTRQERALCGLIAHVTPWRESHQLAERSSEQWWQAIFDRAGLGPVPFVCEHTGWNVITTPDSPRFCPPYFNLGMLLAPAEFFSRIGPTIFNDMEIVNGVTLTLYRCQIALTLSLLRSGWPYRTLPFRYNFPNYAAIAEARPDELRDLRIIHYIGGGFGGGGFEKSETPDSVESIGAWISANPQLPSIHGIFRDRMAEIHSRVLYDLASPWKRLQMLWS